MRNLDDLASNVIKLRNSVLQTPALSANNFFKHALILLFIDGAKLKHEHKYYFQTLFKRKNNSVKSHNNKHFFIEVNVCAA